MKWQQDGNLKIDPKKRWTDVIEEVLNSLRVKNWKEVETEFEVQL